MATATYTGTEKPNYLNWKTSVASWLFTYDHKRLGILYLVSISIFFFHRRAGCRVYSSGAGNAEGRPTHLRCLQ
jgi:hypothetical protein